MLPPERIKPYLLHEDRFVRRAAVNYLAESWSRDPDLVPMILEACDRDGEQESSWLTSHCDRFVLTSSAVERVLERLGRTREANVIAHLNRAIAQAPGELLLDWQGAIQEHPQIQAETRQRVERRCEYTRWTGERLWQELQDFAERSKEKQYVGDIDYGYAGDLVDALAPHDMPDAETLSQSLHGPEMGEGWLEIFIVDLLGARRVVQAIPALVALFHVDTDLLLDRSMRALAMIGDPEVCRLIRAEYPAAESGFRIYATSVFGTIKHPDSEEAILGLLETAEDTRDRTFLCWGLCSLFSEPGVEIVRREIEEGDYDRYITNLEEHLLPVIDVLGIELPEADQWRRRRDQKERRVAANLHKMERMIVPKVVWTPPWRNEPSLPDVEDDQDEPAPVEPAAPVQPIRREGAKVGRNDPCPCGSGKKYKKCCGRSE